MHSIVADALGNHIVQNCDANGITASVVINGETTFHTVNHIANDTADQ